MITQRDSDCCPVIIDTYTDERQADVMQHAYAAMLRRHRLADFFGVECKRIAGMWVIRVGPHDETA